MNRANWSKEESELLKKVYRLKTARELSEIFPQYNNTQILRKAKRLGLKKDEFVAHKSRIENSLISKQDIWSNEEDKILATYYPIVGSKGVKEELFKQLNKERRESAITHRANILKIHRKNRDVTWKPVDIKLSNEEGFSITIKYEGY